MRNGEAGSGSGIYIPRQGELDEVWCNKRSKKTSPLDSLEESDLTSATQIEMAAPLGGEQGNNKTTISQTSLALTLLGTVFPPNLYVAGYAHR